MKSLKVKRKRKSGSGVFAFSTLWCSLLSWGLSALCYRLSHQEAPALCFHVTPFPLHCAGDIGELCTTKTIQLLLPSFLLIYSKLIYFGHTACRILVPRPIEPTGTEQVEEWRYHNLPDQEFNPHVADWLSLSLPRWSLWSHSAASGPSTKPWNIMEYHFFHLVIFGLAPIIPLCLCVCIFINHLSLSLPPLWERCATAMPAHSSGKSLFDVRFWDFQTSRQQIWRILFLVATKIWLTKIFFKQTLI